MSDLKKLINSLKEGNEKALNTLYKMYWRKVYNFCRLYLTNHEETEEIVQDVFVRIWNSRDFIRINDNFEGLLFITTRNLVFNQKRKSFNKNLYSISIISALEAIPDTNSSTVEEKLNAKNLSKHIDFLIDKLPPQRKKIFNLSRKEHKGYREIAIELNLSEKTVEHQISKALKFLREHITGSI